MPVLKFIPNACYFRTNQTFSHFNPVQNTNDLVYLCDSICCTKFMPLNWFDDKLIISNFPTSKWCILRSEETGEVVFQHFFTLELETPKSFVRRVYMWSLPKYTSVSKLNQVQIYNQNCKIHIAWSSRPKIKHIRISAIYFECKMIWFRYRSKLRHHATSDSWYTIRQLSVLNSKTNTFQS